MKKILKIILLQSIRDRINNLEIRQKLFILISLLVLFCIISISSISFIQSNVEIQNLTQGQLTSARNNFKKNVEDYLWRSEIFSKRLAKSRLLEGILLAYESTFYALFTSDAADQELYSQ